MKKAICTTTIYRPSKALLRFVEIAERDGWQLYIAGDLKTPHFDYAVLASEHPCVTYLSPGRQQETWPELSELVGWNCIQRRNFAFLAAYQWGAEVVATVDDDNVPLDGWGEGLLIKGKSGLMGEYQEHLPVFDPLSQTNHNRLWHRGYPLELVNRRGAALASRETAVPFDVQADLWNDEADVDAVCRMVQDSGECEFIPALFPFTANKPSPFNSQNTFLTRRVLPHYFMFPGVGRYDDILAAYHVQAQGFRVVYGAPSVVQERNAHDVMKDFAEEVWGYQHCLAIASKVQADQNAVYNALPEKARAAFDEYRRCFK